MSRPGAFAYARSWRRFAVLAAGLGVVFVLIGVGLRRVARAIPAADVSPVR